jgi:hypothetical protein
MTIELAVSIRPGRKVAVLQIIEDDKILAWAELSQENIWALIDSLRMAGEDLLPPERTQ